MTIRSLPFLSLLILACNEPVELGQRGNPYGASAGQTFNPSGTGGASFNQTTGRVPVCGDGVVEAPEQCDDGNTGGGDGCNANCTLIESGWQCETQGQPCVSSHCGNHVIETALGEQCDDGADNGGISACGLDCQIDINWKPPQGCGNGVVDPGEECDDGNSVSGDGCTVCRIEKGWTCFGNDNRTVCLGVCGDGIVGGAEQCDDGNVGDGDGCSADCTRVESGWQCSTEGQPCVASCGNGIVEVTLGEACDSGKQNGADEMCTVGCQLTPMALLETTCGNGVMDRNEQCDDGNRINGDGCITLCQLTVGASCIGTPSRCSICGDGKVGGAEQCDDGNRINGDGCSATCRSTLNCPADNSLCPTATCGDGTVDAREQCDNGTANGAPYGTKNGCYLDCSISHYCGDGVVDAPFEQCDDGVNDGGYGECAPGCKIGPNCGDGVVDVLNGEQCDDGVNDGGYGECAPGCSIGPHCGDGVIDARYGEQCDGGDGCDAACKIRLTTV